MGVSFADTGSTRFLWATDNPRRQPPPPGGRPAGIFPALAWGEGGWGHGESGGRQALRDLVLVPFLGLGIGLGAWDVGEVC